MNLIKIGTLDSKYKSIVIGIYMLVVCNFSYADPAILHGDILFSLMMLGDDRSIMAVYVNGEKVNA